MPINLELMDYKTHLMILMGEGWLPHLLRSSMPVKMTIAFWVQDPGFDNY